MAQDWFDEATKPVSAPTQRRGQIIRDPYRESDESRKDAANRRAEEDQRFEQQRLALEAERVRLQQQQIEQARIDALRGGLKPGQRLVGAGTPNERIENIPGAVDAEKPSAEGIDRIAALVGQINEVQRQFDEGVGATEGVAGIRDYIPSQENSAFDKAAASLEEIAIGAFKVPGMGATSDADAARMAAAVRPSRYGFDSGARQQLRDIRRRVNEWYNTRGLATPEWVAPQLVSEEKAEVESALRAGDIGRATELMTRYNGVAPAPGMLEAAAAALRENPDRPVQFTPQAGSFGESYIGQGLSGVNEGIANTLGLPVDLATMGINLVPQGVNFLANTNLPTIEDPVAGSEWFRGLLTGAGSIAPETSDPNRQFVRRAGQTVGESVIPGAAGARTARAAGTAAATALGGGLGAATAEQVAPGSPYAEIIGELAGGVAGGAGALASARRAATAQRNAAVPTTAQLRERAGELYREAEQSGVVADPAQTTALRDSVAQVLRDEGRISPTQRLSDVNPNVAETYRMANDYAGLPMTPTQMQTVRGVAADGLMSQDASERRIARLLVNEIDDWVDPMAPSLREARDVASRYLTAEQLERARNLAGARAGQFTGSGYENALRTEYRGLDRDAIRGRGRYGDDLLDAIESVSRGTSGYNAARNVGRLAPTGVVSAGIGTGVPFMIGNAVGGPAVGGALSAATMGVGSAGRAIATQIGIRNAEMAELIARNGGRLPDVDPALTDEQRRVVLALMASQAGSGEYGQ